MASVQYVSEMQVDVGSLEVGVVGSHSQMLPGSWPRPWVIQ